MTRTTCAGVAPRRIRPVVRSRRRWKGGAGPEGPGRNRAGRVGSASGGTSPPAAPKNGRTPGWSAGGPGGRDQFGLIRSGDLRRGRATTCGTRARSRRADGAARGGWWRDGGVSWGPGTKNPRREAGGSWDGRSIRRSRTPGRSRLVGRAHRALPAGVDRGHGPASTGRSMSVNAAPAERDRTRRGLAGRRLPVAAGIDIAAHEQTPRPAPRHHHRDRRRRM